MKFLKVLKIWRKCDFDWFWKTKQRMMMIGNEVLTIMPYSIDDDNIDIDFDTSIC